MKKLRVNSIRTDISFVLLKQQCQSLLKPQSFSLLPSKPICLILVLSNKKIGQSLNDEKHWLKQKIKKEEKHRIGMAFYSHCIFEFLTRKTKLEHKNYQSKLTDLCSDILQHMTMIPVTKLMQHNSLYVIYLLGCNESVKNNDPLGQKSKKVSLGVIGPFGAINFENFVQGKFKLFAENLDPLLKLLLFGIINIQCLELVKKRGDKNRVNCQQDEHYHQKGSP